MEYAFRRDFENLVQKFSLESKSNKDNIFSVTEKIPKRNEFRTDAIAIRDSLAHYSYSINDIEDSWEIKFDNEEGGYNFKQTFSERGFLAFLENTDLPYKTQLHLLWIFIANLVGSSSFTTR